MFILFWVMILETHKIDYRMAIVGFSFLDNLDFLDKIKGILVG